MYHSCFFFSFFRIAAVLQRSSQKLQWKRYSHCQDSTNTLVIPWSSHKCSYNSRRQFVLNFCFAQRNPRIVSVWTTQRTLYRHLRRRAWNVLFLQFPDLIWSWIIKPFWQNHTSWRLWIYFEFGRSSHLGFLVPPAYAYYTY